MQDQVDKPSQSNESSLSSQNLQQPSQVPQIVQIPENQLSQTNDINPNIQASSQYSPPCAVPENLQQQVPQIVQPLQSPINQQSESNQSSLSSQNVQDLKGPQTSQKLQEISQYSSPCTVSKSLPTSQIIQSPVDQQSQSSQSSLSSQNSTNIQLPQPPQITENTHAPSQYLQSVHPVSSIPRNSQPPQTPQIVQNPISSPTVSTSKHLFRFDLLPPRALKNIFFRLSKKDLIKFMTVDPELNDAVYEFLKEVVIITKNYYVNEPFFQNLFYTNEYVDHKTVIRINALNIFKEKGHLDVDKQIRKLIANEFLKDIELFKNLEHLEILIGSESISLESEFELNLKNLKILCIELSSKYNTGLSVKINSSSLSTLKLVNLTNINVSNPEHVEYLHLDDYDKLANNFHNLLCFSCRDFRHFKNGLLNKKSMIRVLKLTNVTSNNLNNLFNLKKKFKLKTKIYVQGIKVSLRYLFYQLKNNRENCINLYSLSFCK